MCGIAGIAIGANGRVDLAFVPTAMRLLKHRGPDDAGYLLYSSRGVTTEREWRGDPRDAIAALVSRRLAILDLSEAGRQPMSTPDGRYHLVFNGEIYNYVELRQELEALGHRFRSRSDTEVLLAAYAQWGAAALPRLIGMFAFVVIDTRQRRLVLARDCFGIKPLYYILDGGRFTFASEVPALLDLSGCKRQANPVRVFAYLRHGCSDFGDETFLTGVRQLPPASYLSISLDQPAESAPVQYWAPRLGPALDISFDEAAGRLRTLFLDSIRLHLRSDVPVGTALSGGIDSSAIVTAMRHLQGPQLEIHAFGYVAEPATISEEKWLEIAADASGAVVHKVRCGANDLMNDLEPMIRSQGEPFGGSSVYAQYRVFHLAQEAGVKVMLDGQGADELLAGYHWYHAARLASLIRNGRWAESLRFLNRAAGRSGMGRRGLLGAAGEFLLPTAMHGLGRRVLGRGLIPRWMNGGWFADRGVRTEVERLSRPRDVLKWCLGDSLTTRSLPQLLRYEDRNSMASSMESRVPFLTPVLAEFLLSLPEQYLLDAEGTTKAVFRKAMEGIVPQAILDRKDKIGFAAPEAAWLQTLAPWVERTLRSEAAGRIPVLKHAEVQAFWRRYIENRHGGTTAWRWVNLIEWSRLFDVRFD
jgi:asparagine synthase (glutamine-hydrolysing)